MQTLSEIRALLDRANLRPQKRFGQCFLHDQNLMRQIVELAFVGADDVVLEVGPGTGSLTQELLDRAGKVVAVEVDRGLAGVLRTHFAERPNLQLIEADVLAGKHAIEPAVLAAVAPRASLVSNLPYNIATPLLAGCLVSSWRALRASEAGDAVEASSAGTPQPVRFDRMTFTVQKEVGDRLVAGPGTSDYGPVSVLVALLSEPTVGAVVPASAFWPAPKIASRILRLDFSADKASAVADVDVLQTLVAGGFGHRRKQLGFLVRRGCDGLAPEILGEAFAAAGVDTSRRAETVSPAEFLAVANTAARQRR